VPVVFLQPCQQIVGRPDERSVIIQGVVVVARPNLLPVLPIHSLAVGLENLLDSPFDQNAIDLGFDTVGDLGSHATKPPSSVDITSNTSTVHYYECKFVITHADTLRTSTCDVNAGQILLIAGVRPMRVTPMVAIAQFNEKCCGSSDRDRTLSSTANFAQPRDFVTVSLLWA
jgi:hypothetical protein